MLCLWRWGRADTGGAGVKSASTIRRWVKELQKVEGKTVPMETYRQGAICALHCVLYSDWSNPIEFVKFGGIKKPRSPAQTAPSGEDGR